MENSPELLYYAVRIPPEIDLHNLAINHPVDGYPFESQFPTCWGYAQEIAAVGTVKHITVSHQVAFCYLDLVGTVVVWESLAYLSYVPLELFGKVGSHEFVECVPIPCRSLRRPCYSLPCFLASSCLAPPSPQPAFPTGSLP